MKVPVMYNVNRANKRRIKKFQKQLKKSRPDLEADGYTVAVQDETIVMAETRARKDVYTLYSTSAPCLHITAIMP